MQEPSAITAIAAATKKPVRQTSYRTGDYHIGVRMMDRPVIKAAPKF